MDIYIMGIVNCPMNKTEQDADICLLCPHYAGQEVNAGQSSHPRLNIVCNFKAKGIEIYQSSKSGLRATLVKGEPLPPTSIEGESWKRVRI